MPLLTMFCNVTDDPREDRPVSRCVRCGARIHFVWEMLEHACAEVPIVAVRRAGEFDNPV